MIRQVNAAENQLRCNQDITYTSHIVDKASNTETWKIAIMDGHGKLKYSNIHPFTQKYEKYNLCVDVLREMKVMKKGQTEPELEYHFSKDIFGEEDPALSLQRAFCKIAIDYDQNLLKVGATLSLVKIIHDKNTRKIKVEVITVGDSPVSIFCNGEHVFESVLHNDNNPDEIIRLLNEGRIVKGTSYFNPGNSFEILDNDFMSYKPGFYFNTTGVSLQMSQSLGHIEKQGKKIMEETGVLGLCPFKASLEFEETDELNIKVYSDGVGDVILPKTLDRDYNFMKTSTALQTVEYATIRWKKNWKYCSSQDYHANKSSKIDIPYSDITLSSTDDISCVSWIQKKKTL